MKNFKPRQKAVYRNLGYTKDMRCIVPKDGEVITINGPSLYYKDSWYIKEYPVAINGTIQSFVEEELFPLDDDAITLTMTRAELR